MSNTLKIIVGIVGLFCLTFILAFSFEGLLPSLVSDHILPILPILIVSSTLVCWFLLGFEYMEKTFEALEEELKNNKGG